ncbi:MAG: BamA/TamA family outer membrane protein [Balneolales bacterium]|nr:BamA/TamA family outer membrane protein [Balneolales bacterium]
MKKSFLLKCFVLFFLVIGLSTRVSIAQGIKVLDVNGNKQKVPAELLQLISQVEFPSPEIIKWYSDLGFLDVKVRPLPQDSLVVEMGCAFDMELQMPSGVQLGKYSSPDLQNRIHEELHNFEQEGYYFASAEIDEFQIIPDSCRVTIAVTVEKGERIRTDEVIFPGSKTNKPVYLQKISGYQDSMLVTPDYLEELQSNLIGSELFEDVSEPEVALDEEEVVILIQLEERNLNRFDGLLGYVPDDAGNGQIVGDFDLSLWNVFRQGNGVSLLFQRLRPETTRLDAGISQHWFGNIPVGAEVSTKFYQNDTTYQTRSFILNGYYQLNADLRLTSGIGQVNSTSSNSAPVLLEPDGKRRYAHFGFRFSNLNNVEVPSQGSLFEIVFGVTNKSVEIDSVSAFRQQYLDAFGKTFLPLTSRSVLAFRTQAFYLLSDQITENDMIRFGGANSLRGYSEEQFNASRVLWGDVEYRFLTDRFSYLFTFVAAGAYHRPRLLTEEENTFKASEFLYSAGFGMSYRIRIGRLKFSYAISPSESIGNGKVHVGIITSL